MSGFDLELYKVPVFVYHVQSLLLGKEELWFIQQATVRKKHYLAQCLKSLFHMSFAEWLVSKRAFSTEKLKS